MKPTYCLSLLCLMLGSACLLAVPVHQQKVVTSRLEMDGVVFKLTTDRNWVMPKDRGTPRAIRLDLIAKNRSESKKSFYLFDTMRVFVRDKNGKQALTGGGRDGLKRAPLYCGPLAKGEERIISRFNAKLFLDAENDARLICEDNGFGGILIFFHLSAARYSVTVELDRTLVITDGQRSGSKGHVEMPPCEVMVSK